LADPPERFGSLMQSVIRRCGALDPSERPSFQDIFNEFESSGWVILPDTDAGLVAKSVAEVIRQETCLNHSGV
jgi:hypothetical protein